MNIKCGEENNWGDYFFVGVSSIKFYDIKKK